jgi:hypothetical protein
MGWCIFSSVGYCFRRSYLHYNRKIQRKTFEGKFDVCYLVEVKFDNNMFERNADVLHSHPISVKTMCDVYPIEHLAQQGKQGSFSWFKKP